MFTLVVGFCRQILKPRPKSDLTLGIGLEVWQISWQVILLNLFLVFCDCPLIDKSFALQPSLVQSGPQGIHICSMVYIPSLVYNYYVSYWKTLFIYGKGLVKQILVSFISQKGIISWTLLLHIKLILIYFSAQCYSRYTVLPNCFHLR